MTQFLVRQNGLQKKTEDRKQEEKHEKNEKEIRYHVFHCFSDARIAEKGEIFGTFHIIVPPAFRTMLPGLFNQFIISVKDTAMLSVIVVNEITKQIQNYAALSFKTIQAYTTGAVFYLVLISILILAQKWIERKMAN